MDRDFEKKVKRKRLRAVVIALIVIAAAVYLIADLKVEKADYGSSLAEEIETARALYEEQKENTGNEKGQYAPYTLMEYDRQIQAAEAVADSEDSEYNDEKDAYETLKEQTKAFRKAANSQVISADEMTALMKDKDSRTETVEIGKDKEMTVTVDGGAMKKAVTVNLMAKEEGPNADLISEILGQLSLQGKVLSFYQDGTFGGELKITAPMYSEKKTEAYAYKVDLEKGSLQYVSDAKVDTESQTADFTVSEGGDYVVLTTRMHEDSDKAVDISDAEKKAKAAESGEGESTAGGSGGQSGNSGSSQPADKPAAEDIEVTVEIRCDTLAADLSKLEDPALEAYVPSDGTILGSTKVKVEKGSTVYDALNKVCRNKGIHLEASYTPAYGSYYVEGINYLYEFDGGSMSGWMYKVNGKFPNYGCSEYTLSDGDAIVWCYTLDRGKDVGGGV
ncbi:MAG: DUF4430 domain-containing protein [Emergencia sp.]